MANILITSGGTVIPIDSVRKICNMSKGTFGSKIADYAICQGYNVDFLCAKDSKIPVHASEESSKIDITQYVTFLDYAKSLDNLLKKQPDIVILAAAVSDYEVENYVDGKIRSKEDLVIRLKPLPKLISTVREKSPDSIICGFKLLVNSTVDELCKESIKSLISNKLDLVVGNDLRDIKNDKHILRIVENFYGNIRGEAYEAKHFDLAKVVVDKCMEHYNRKNQNQ